MIELTELNEVARDFGQSSPPTPLQADLRRLKSEWQVQLVATVVENSDPTDVDAPVVWTPSSERSDGGVQATELIEPLGQAGRPARLALLFGNEANGLDPEWLELCDRRLTIPMHAADSLNVAVAAGIFLYHFTTSALDAFPTGQSVSTS